MAQSSSTSTGRGWHLLEKVPAVINNIGGAGAVICAACGGIYAVARGHPAIERPATSKPPMVPPAAPTVNYVYNIDRSFNSAGRRIEPMVRGNDSTSASVATPPWAPSDPLHGRRPAGSRHSIAIEGEAFHAVSSDEPFPAKQPPKLEFKDVPQD